MKQARFHLHPWRQVTTGVLVLVHLCSLFPAQQAIAQVEVSPSLAALPTPVTTLTTGPTLPSRSFSPAKVVVNTTAPKGIQAAAPLAFSAKPSVAEIAQCRLFAEPLLPMGEQPSSGETSSLAQAILAFDATPNHEDPSALEQFLAAYPQSAFRVALLTNLGVLYRHGGYWSKALNSWQQAWDAGKGETNPTNRLIVDRALSQLAEMTARLGRVDELTAIVKDADNRAVSGAAAERYNEAKESLFLEQTEPTKSFRCGPFAVGKILDVLRPGEGPRTEVHESVSTDHGTSLPMVKDFAHKLGLDYQMAFRSPGATVLLPSVVNWKVGHYAALTKEINGHYLVEDSTFSDNFVVSQQALDDEASGYFLVRAGTLPVGWRAVSIDEGNKVWGKGAASPTGPSAPCCNNPSIKPCPFCYGMPDYDVDPSRVGLALRDIPLFYNPPHGPKIEFAVSYLQRETAPSSGLTYSGLGPQWSTNWVSFIVDDPYNSSTTSYGPGGGMLTYTGYQGTAATGAFAPQLLTQGILQRTSASSYVRTHPDGSKEIFGLADTSSPKRVYLTEYDDPAGNKLTYTYDTYFRLRSVGDALNQYSTLTYVSDDTTVTNGDFYRIKTVTDPFSRTASFAYYTSGPSAGWLQQITDMAGMSSQFTYSNTNAVSGLVTPYGTTSFQVNDSGTDRSLLITDPQGAQEKVVFKRDMAPPDTGAAIPAASGLYTAHPSLLEFRTSYYWDKKAYGVAPNDYSKAHLYHWTHGSGPGVSSDVLESEKPALESRIYYNYLGQTNSNYASELGATNQPTKIARVLDDQSTQLTQYDYNPQGKMTKRITPGDSSTPARTTTYKYDTTNNIDLIAVYQQNPAGASTDGYGVAADLLQSFVYDTLGKHLIVQSTDAAGQHTNYTYNSYGQILTITNAKNETTTFTYDGNQAGVSGQTDGYLTTVTAPAAGAVTQFDHDGYGRYSKVTDSEGYIVVTGFDALNRVTTRTYPDTTTEEIIYDRMEPQWTKDRLNRWTELLHDELRHLTGVIDPMNRLTQYEWCNCGALEAIIDGNGNKTTWMRDVESRITSKIYADNSVWSTTYENTTSRVKSTTDAKQQQTNYQYNIDDSIHKIWYSDTSGNDLVPPTPSVSYAYDTVYPRLSGSTVRRGSIDEPTIYAYNPVPLTATLGAGRLSSETGPYANSTVAFSYDELGRVNQQSVDGNNNNSSFTYDTLGRTHVVSNALGSFTYNYLNNTNRLDNVAFPNGQTTQYAYFNGTNDPRLQTIANKNSSGGVISQFDYTYSAVGDILSWKQNDSGLSHPQQYQLGYDADSELTSATLQDTVTGSTLNEQAYNYDAAMNRISVQNGNSVTTETPNTLNQLTQTTGGGIMRFAGTVSKPATVTVGGNPATARADGSYEGWARVSGTSTTQVHIVATDNTNNRTDKYVNVSPSAVATQNFSYDQNGNQTASGPSSGQTIYGWDAADRLITITQGSNVTQFDYDGENRRIREKLNGTEIRHWVWMGSSLAEERDPNNNVTKRFFVQGEQIVGKNYFCTRDHLGSLREMSDSTQNLRARYNYDLYGTRSSNLVAMGAVEADFGFTNYYFSHDHSLYLAMFRAYDPVDGRWLSRDNIEQAEIVQGTNLYAYTTNNPLFYVDPDGRYAIPWPSLIPELPSLPEILPLILAPEVIIPIAIGIGLGIAGYEIYNYLNDPVSPNEMCTKGWDHESPNPDKTGKRDPRRNRPDGKRNPNRPLPSKPDPVEPSTPPRPYNPNGAGQDAPPYNQPPKDGTPERPPSKPLGIW